MGSGGENFVVRHVQYLPSVRHLLVYALFIWMPFSDPITPLEFWNDNDLFQAACARFIYCPRCRAKPGKACIGVRELWGQALRLHHYPRTIAAELTYRKPREKLTVIPFVVVCP